MELTNKFLTLAALVLISAFASLSHAAQAKGEITISDNGSKLQAKLKVTTGDKQGRGSGYLRYSDDTSKVHIRVKYLKIDGKYAWFAGECVEDGVDHSGRWFFGAVHDGGKPGRLVDQIWWEWIPQGNDAEAVARSKVENLQIPSERKDIESGDIEVSD